MTLKTTAVSNWIKWQGNPDHINSWIQKNGIDYPGVYVICEEKSGKIIYIGSSTNVGKRLNSHRSTRGMLGSQESVMIRVRKDKKAFERLSLEAKLIHRIQPAKNRRFCDINNEDQIEEKSSSEKNTIKTISVPTDLWDRVQCVGKVMGEAASGVIRMALRDTLPKYEGMTRRGDEKRNLDKANR